MTLTTDTLVVGAGPAGTAAAAILARSGHDVLVVDKATFPRDKCCGDGLTALALRELEELGLDPRAVESWRVVDEVIIRSPAGKERRYSLPTGAGYHAAVARRLDLDAALVELAAGAGARVEQGVAFRGASPSESGVTAELDGIGTVHARHLIAADGMWSPVRKSLGLAIDGYRGEWHAFRQYFENVSPRAGNELIVWFEKDLLPGYAWSFPLADGRANIGFGIQRGGNHQIGDMKRLWPDLLSRPHIREVLGPDARPEDPHKAWPIPARVGRVPLSGPHTMFVGDAAAVTDPMTGEGIGQALLTGRLAAQAILAGGDAPAAYERETRRELVADDRMARLLIPLLGRPLIARGALKLTGATPWTRRNFARWMFEDYPRAMVATPRRWRRGMFTGPGAYASSPDG
jgi:geranylgeranyl reductase family protein